MLKAVETAQNSSENNSDKYANSVNTEKEIPIQPVSLDIWDKKYRLKSKQGEHVSNHLFICSRRGKML